MIKFLARDNGIKTRLYPDNQPHVQIITDVKYHPVMLKWGIQSSKNLVELMMLSDALDRLNCEKRHLIIPYLMGARYDRPMEDGGSVDLKVVARMINACGFKRVEIFEPHSDVALGMIENSYATDNRYLVGEYKRPNAVLICPDAGAAKKVSNYMEWNPNLKDVVYCIKHRDTTNGKLSLKVLDAHKTVNRNCVIIDDLCDGGGTFKAIASQILPANLTLIVSHGIFSKGFDTIAEDFDQVITSDSYRQYQTINNHALKIINV